MYKAGIYSRVSREDGDKMESESLANQRQLIKSFVSKQRDIEIVEYYSDDNYTGTNFKRPEFQRMYNDIVEEKINCVIVKDLSRFGRDYIEVGRYLQREFPKLKVRFIAINDNIDSMRQQYDMLMPVKNIFNEQYARDISTKIISTFREKQASGKFIGAFPSYGYKKDPNDKYHLVIDEYAADVVRRIFRLFIDGKGKITIARILNDEKILCPAEYKKAMGYKYTNSHKLSSTSYWTYSTIHKILNNELYIGNMVQHRSNCSKFDYSPVQIDKEKWFRVENTHDPIIDIETWNTTQGLLTRRARQMSFEQNVSMFAGFLVCADCGRAMAKITNRNKATYVCGTYKRYPSVGCSRHAISEEILSKIILADINQILSKVENIKSIVESRVAKKSASEYEEKGCEGVHDLRAQLDKIRHLKKSLYEDYRTGILSREEYIDYKADYDAQEKNISGLIQKINDSNMTKEDVILESDFVRSLKKGHITELNRETLESIYSKIFIYENKGIKFQYKFKEIVEEIQKF